MKYCKLLLTAAFLLLVLYIHAPARADSSLFKVGPEGTEALLADPAKTPMPKTVKDYANVFYSNCMAANKNISMKPYMAQQCACTAANMTDTMSLADVTALFDKNSDDNYPYTRFLMLAYVPCMSDSLHDIVYDNCASDPTNRVKLRNAPRVCQCVADGMGKFFDDVGQNLLPGYGRKGFDKKQAVDNPMAAALANISTAGESQYYMSRCVQENEYNW